ncbi:glycosyltransferase [Pseudoroseomonas wenyumeiae]|uniref:Glycosyltransferase n=1 Tax=Teichococcus wenyumeiae TaxID=2478470 RepID=A0A3A9J9M9_9PROT|nr:glycosyltransferase [Pseudoroseomonas wenyumeiae]RKK01423.1 glycosyltransferase [Pseudoroseomonas wenyumeiae]RMI15247.1 glycosyltransferase [Pseudoroseomonas wenyumeiae]
MTDQTLDCVVRFHNPQRLNELSRCVFSLLGQKHRPLNIIISLQRFSEADVAAVREALQPLFDLPEAPQLTICNLEQSTPADARTLLLNMGISAAAGRYLAFLDYDDVLYPEAYSLLRERLRQSDAAIAFASVRVVRADVFPTFLYVREQVEKPFGPGDRLRDLFDGNFCPIHSFLIDRHKVQEADLIFDSTLTWEEDYDLLLRICAKYKSDFHLIGKVIGDYYYKTDASNSIPVNGIHASDKLQAYERVSIMIEARRRTTLVAESVQAEYGLVPTRSDMSIRDFMAAVPGRTY